MDVNGCKWYLVGRSKNMFDAIQPVFCHSFEAWILRRCQGGDFELGDGRGGEAFSADVLLGLDSNSLNSCHFD